MHRPWGNSLESVKKDRRGHQPAGSMSEEGVMDSPLWCLDLIGQNQRDPL